MTRLRRPSILSYLQARHPQLAQRSEPSPVGSDNCPATGSSPLSAGGGDFMEGDHRAAWPDYNVND